MIMTALSLAASLFSASLEEMPERKLDVTQYHDSSNVLLRVSNFGFFGSGNNMPQWPSLEYPAGSGIDYLYQGAVWIGAKLQRRDIQGRRYFWNQWPPGNENDVVAEFSPSFDPDIHTIPVIDTLTSVGFDGDYSFYQLLPAYYPFESNYLGQQYAEYNYLDVVMRSILGYPSPSDETFPLDSDGIFGFFFPSGETGDFPGLETMTSFYYDYSPFTPFGQPRHRERKEGISAGSFQHHPLYLAVRQQSFTWTYQDLYEMIFFSFDIHNATPADTLYDVAVAMFMDCDAGPQSWDGDTRSMDDVSGYYAGEGYEFAYTRDYDGDGGLTPHWAALKLFPDEDYNFSCWNWTRGDGPDHRQPRRIPPLPGLITSNEKYWLMTGCNANEDKFNVLRPEGWLPGMDPHYEEPVPHDTKFLYSIYGDMEGYNNSTSNSLNIPPGESISMHGVIFMGDDLDDLKSKSIIAQTFYDSGYDLSLYAGVPAIPFIVSAELSQQNIEVEWFHSEDADEQYLYYKKAEDPASEWIEVELDPSAESYAIENIDLYYVYNIKIGNLFNGLYLESIEYSILASPTSINDDYVTGPPERSQLIGNFPNPFNPETQIAFQLAGRERVKLEVFNIKGQLISTVIDGQFFDEGFHSIRWDSRDKRGDELPSGVYFYQLTTDNAREQKKMLLLK